MNWAYSQLNLGEAVEALATLYGVEPSEAVDELISESRPRLAGSRAVAGRRRAPCNAPGRWRSRAARPIAQALESVRRSGPLPQRKGDSHSFRQAHDDLLVAERLMHDAT